MTNNEFGKNLQLNRKLFNLTQRKLGQALGVCNQTISCWENGQREPDLDTLVKIAKIFDVSVDSLLD